MRAGLLARAHITILRASVTQNSFGEDVVTWSNLLSCWANIRAMKGREMETAQQTWAEARFKIDMRFQKGTELRRKDRLLWGTRTLDILDVEDPDQTQRRLFLIAKEFVS